DSARLKLILGQSAGAGFPAASAIRRKRGRYVLQPGDAKPDRMPCIAVQHLAPHRRIARAADPNTTDAAIASGAVGGHGSGNPRTSERTTRNLDRMRPPDRVQIADFRPLSPSWSLRGDILAPGRSPAKWR